MKLILPDALHARPANLLVRAAAQLPCTIHVIRGDKRADAAEILQVLGLGAAKGDEIELECDDPRALLAIAQLIEREFDPDLVPEHVSGAAAGIAIGEAVLLVAEDEQARERGSDEEERARARAAFARARDEVAAIVFALPRHEAILFEPELTILHALEPSVLARISAGESAEDAVRAEAVHGPSDLIDDARMRLLDALAGGVAAHAQRLEGLADRELVLVVEGVTPSLIAALPANVVGVIAALGDEDAEGEAPRAVGSTSHAAILARGRGLPLAYAPSHVVYAIEHGGLVVLDTTATPARIWPSPSEALVDEARARREALRMLAEEESLRARAPLPISVSVRVNIGSTREEVPVAAAGIGLVRSELLFAERTTEPREDEQAAAYATIARKTSCPVNVRLFDAGGDKPLPFLPAPVHAPDARGIALLCENPSALAAQLRAIGRARDAGEVRVVIPLTRDAADVDAVRRAAPPGLPIGAMIETPEAAAAIDAIAAAADFICIGTNDLASTTLNVPRELGPDPLDPRVLAHVQRTIEGAHGYHRSVTVCGEVAADPFGARVLVGLGVDALSVAPSRLAPLRLGLSDATDDDCRAAARLALAGAAGRQPA